MQATKFEHISSDAVAIYIDSDVEFDPEHDEYRTWQVFVGDDDADPVSEIVTFNREQAALEYANMWGRNAGLEVHNG